MTGTCQDCGDDDADLQKSPDGRSMVCQDCYFDHNSSKDPLSDVTDGNEP